MAEGTMLEDLKETIGGAAVMNLLAAKGGRTVYIPYTASLTDDHWLVKAIGFEAASKMTEQYTTETLCLPLGPEKGLRVTTHKKVIEMALAGASVSAIAYELGIHSTTVRRIKRKYLG